MLWRYPGHTVEYEAIDDALAVYVLTVADVLYKRLVVLEMSRRDAEAFTTEQREVRKNVQAYQKEPY
jgi:hypothetical protein